MQKPDQEHAEPAQAAARCVLSDAGRAVYAKAAECCGGDLEAMVLALAETVAYQAGMVSRGIARLPDPDPQEKIEVKGGRAFLPRSVLKGGIQPKP